jgi:hypothetical protein
VGRPAGCGERRRARHAPLCHAIGAHSLAPCEPTFVRWRDGEVERSTIDHWLAGGELATRCVARVTAGTDGTLLAGDAAPLAGGGGHNAVTM